MQGNELGSTLLEPMSITTDGWRIGPRIILRDDINLGNNLNTVPFNPILGYSLSTLCHFLLYSFHLTFLSYFHDITLCRVKKKITFFLLFLIPKKRENKKGEKKEREKERLRLHYRSFDIFISNNSIKFSFFQNCQCNI